jgi:hypothetical protein
MFRKVPPPRPFPNRFSLLSAKNVLNMLSRSLISTRRSSLDGCWCMGTAAAAEQPCLEEHFHRSLCAKRPSLLSVATSSCSGLENNNLVGTAFLDLPHETASQEQSPRNSLSIPFMHVRSLLQGTVFMEHHQWSSLYDLANSLQGRANSLYGIVSSH